MHALVQQCAAGPFHRLVLLLFTFSGSAGSASERKAFKHVKCNRECKFQTRLFFCTVSIHNLLLLHRVNSQSMYISHQ